jgi:hypothetical protein
VTSLFNFPEDANTKNKKVLGIQRVGQNSSSKHTFLEEAL